MGTNCLYVATSSGENNCRFALIRLYVYLGEKSRHLFYFYLPPIFCVHGPHDTNPDYNRDVPIYEYHCADCNTTFERLRTMAGAGDATPCEHCTGTKTERLLSMFYATSHSDKSTVSTNAGCCAGGMCDCTPH